MRSAAFGWSGLCAVFPELTQGTASLRRLWSLRDTVFSACNGSSSFMPSLASSTPHSTREKFYGWWITLFAFFTFGIAVGIPYYGGPFFYDYYMKAFGWNRADVTLGFPLAATLTLWVGPLLVHRFSPRKMILVGTGFSAIAFIGFGLMKGSLISYYFFWFLYVIGYIFSGPIAHQVVVSQWFRRNR